MSTLMTVLLEVGAVLAAVPLLLRLLKLDNTKFGAALIELTPDLIGFYNKVVGKVEEK